MLGLLLHMNGCSPALMHVVSFLLHGTGGVTPQGVDPRATQQKRKHYQLRHAKSSVCEQTQLHGSIMAAC